MFGLNGDQNQQQDTASSEPQVDTKSNPALPDNLNSPLLPNLAAPLPPGPSNLGDSSATSAPAVLPAEPRLSPSGQDIKPVNLDNAYIATDSPHISAAEPSIENKPSAIGLVNGASEDEMMRMKQKALQSLAPLVDHLDQTPEEKFKTTMMLLQASDNPELVKDAFDAANLIQDEKVRAQALLDVVNEINYFTQHGASPPQPSVFS